jgi:hypothetical protein
MLRGFMLLLVIIPALCLTGCPSYLNVHVNVAPPSNPGRFIMLVGNQAAGFQTIGYNMSDGTDTGTTPVPAGKSMIMEEMVPGTGTLKDYEVKIGSDPSQPQFPCNIDSNGYISLPQNTNVYCAVTNTYDPIPVPSAPTFEPPSGCALIVIVYDSGATEIHYTTDGSVPTQSSHLYNPVNRIPITSLRETVSAIGINREGTSPVTSVSYVCPPAKQ